MRIALIAPPFIPIPPARYGGTELFVGQLAVGLQRLGHDVVVYANGESTVPCEVRWLYEKSDWPPEHQAAGALKNLAHAAWAVRDAVATCEVLHLNDCCAVPFAAFVSRPAVLTIHHPHEPAIVETIYEQYPEVTYVSISHFQDRQLRMPRRRVIHHGVDVDEYRFVDRKQRYLSFLGRFAPIKGVHLAIEVARRTGIPLKLAGEIQPVYRDYWEAEVAPHVDGRLIEYLGEADHALKNDLLANSMALLFPIQWDEPFGLVMIEAMACGTPVLALPSGSVPEVVLNGTSGWICADLDEMVDRVRNLSFEAAACRRYVVDRFSLDRMVGAYSTLYEEIVRPQGGRDQRESLQLARGVGPRA